MNLMKRIYTYVVFYVVINGEYNHNASKCILLTSIS